MIRNGLPSTKRAAAAVAALLVMSMPLLARAQEPATPPANAAAADSAAKPAGAAPAAPEAGAPAATPVAKPPMPAALSDSARAAVRAQVEKELKAMADSLKLTPSQRSKARPILLEHAYQLRELRTKYATHPRTAETREAMAKDAQTLRDATDAKLAEIMSGDQITRYKQMRDEMLTRARSRMSVPDSTGGVKK